MPSIFSKIISGEIPAYVVAENEHYIAFLDVFPLKKGHTLIVPKKEVDYMFDLDDTTLSGLLIFSKEIAHAIKKAISSNSSLEKDSFELLKFISFVELIGIK